MHTPRQVNFVASSLLTLAIACASSPVRADDAIDENRRLKERLARLEAIVQHLVHGQHREKQLRSDERQQRAAKAAAQTVETKGPASIQPSSIVLDISHGLTAKTVDDAYSFHLGGRVHVDGGASSARNAASAPPPMSLRLVYRSKERSRASSTIASNMILREATRPPSARREAFVTPMSPFAIRPCNFPSGRLRSPFRSEISGSRWDWKGRPPRTTPTSWRDR